MNEILIPILAVTMIGLICGVGLAVASHVMAVKEDERFPAIRECLPGANCGACGFTGCDGYAKALTYFDEQLPRILEKMQDEDILMITADHGCDPGFLKTTDHTREYVPCLIYGKEIKAGVNLHTKKGFADMAATIAEALGSTYRGDGESFWGEIRNKR